MRTEIIAVVAILMLDLCPTLLAGAADFVNKTDLVQSDYTISIASQNQGLFQNQNLNQTEKTNPKNYNQYPRYKSEATATFLALFPGVLIHGIGHFYAGDYLSGSILLGIELISYATFVHFTGSSFWHVNETEKNHDLRYMADFAILMGFLGSWVYDFIHASTAAHNYNNKIRAQVLFSSDEFNDIKVSLSFAF